MKLHIYMREICHLVAIFKNKQSLQQYYQPPSFLPLEISLPLWHVAPMQTSEQYLKVIWYKAIQVLNEVKKFGCSALVWSL